MCDGEVPSIYEVTNPKANKAHECCECLGTIEKGTKYEHVKGMWGGDFGVFKTCQECLELRNAIQENLKYYCKLHGGLFENAEEEISYIEDKVARFGVYRKLITAQQKPRKRLKTAK